MDNSGFDSFVSANLGKVADSKLTVGDVTYVDRNAPSSLGMLNRGMARAYGQHAEALNSQARSRNGPRNINTLTDMEFSRLLNTLNRIANM